MSYPNTTQNDPHNDINSVVIKTLSISKTQTSFSQCTLLNNIMTNTNFIKFIVRLKIYIILIIYVKF
jgi:hypothetical protein